MIFNKKKRSGWLAIDVRNEHIEFAHVYRTGDDKPQVTVCASYSTSGPDATTLAKLRKELKLNDYRCTTLLKVYDYEVHQIEAPNVPPDEVKAAMRWRVKDVIDYSIDAATVDVLNIPVDPNAPARNNSVYAITARNSVIESCVAAFTQAQIPLEVIDIPELAQRNIAQLLEPEGRGIAMLAFYETEGMLTFTSGGELYLARRIDIALEQLLDADAEHRNQHFERIALELQRSLDHLDSQYHHVPIAKVVLAPLPQDIGLQQYLASNIYVPVEMLDLKDVMDLSDVPDLELPARQHQCFKAIGAALRLEAQA